ENLSVYFGRARARPMDQHRISDPGRRADAECVVEEMPGGQVPDQLLIDARWTRKIEVGSGPGLWQPAEPERSPRWPYSPTRSPVPRLPSLPVTGMADHCLRVKRTTARSPNTTKIAAAQTSDSPT